jgi:hypothetical protein
MNKYDQIDVHIDYVRRRLKQDSDDSYFTDEEIYKALIDARGKVVYNKFKKNREYSSWLYQTVCLPLCIDSFHDCKCVPDGFDCKVLRTTVEIPKPLWSGYDDVFRMTKLDGSEIFASTIQKSRYNKYKKTGTNNPYYIISNKKASIFNIPQNRLKYILITGIFEDPAALEELSVCPDGTDDCDQYAISSGFGSEITDNIDIYNLAIKSLVQTMQMLDDRSNDADSTPTQKEI